MSCESVGEPLWRRPSASFTLPQHEATIAMDNMAELVRESAPLAHRMPAGGDGDESHPAQGVSHRQAMLLRRGLDNGNIIARGLLDNSDEVP